MIPNALLAALPAADYRRMAPEMLPVELVFGEVLHEADTTVRHVYFPGDSLVSLLALVDRHDALEVGLVGREGMVGVACALGVARTPFRALVQGSGSALRMKTSAFRTELEVHGALHQAVGVYAHALLAQVSRTAACNRFHAVPERLARWLLMTRDRVRSNRFRLTHAFLGNMLGVRREGVSNAAHGLHGRGLIDYSRGNIVILDGPGLEAAACSCYARSGPAPDQWAATGGSRRSVSRRTTS